MGRFLEKVWVRFGAYVTLSAFITLSVVVTFAMWSEAQDRVSFAQSLPTEVASEMLELIRTGKEHSRRANQIYAQYGPEDGPEISAMAVFGLSLSVFLGTVAAFFSARIFTRPLTSTIEAALRIAHGDLSARATPVQRGGELTSLIENFNFMADSLERLDRDRRESVAAMSHELRTPLTILQGRLHALCDGVIAPSDEEFQRLLHQTRHLVHLVEDMHTLSLIDAGRFSLNFSHVELGAFMQEVMLFYVQNADSCGVRLKLTLHTEPVFIQCDRDRMRQVVANLIQNALHYAASGGVLMFEVNNDGAHAVIEISDRGPGIDPADIESIFHAFFRANTDTTRRQSGSGLGLAIVSRIVEQHCGSITASNHPLGGACFTVRLPLASQD